MSDPDQRSSAAAVKAAVLWLAIFLSVLLWSAVRPHDYFTRFMEILPALIAFIILAATYKCFRLCSLVYWLILVHSVP
jgi:putative membrane protein